VSSHVWIHEIRRRWRWNAGPGAIGNYIVQELLEDNAAGIVKEIASVILTRQAECPSSD
jgi:hypothetical protein